MAGQEVQGMLIRLEATTAQLRQEMARADSSVAQVSGRIDRQLAQVDSAFDRLGLSAQRVGGLLKGALAIGIGGAGIGALISQAEAYTQIANRMKLVTSNSTEFAAAQNAVFSIAQKSGQPLTATAELYQRIAQNQDALKLSGKGVAGIVETISKTMVISGASAESSKAALIQLGQAFASGTLRGEELNSVMEQAPALSQAIAKGMGVSVGALRVLGAEGKLTAESVVKALQAQQGAVDALFGKMQDTIGVGLTRVQTSFTKMIGEGDKVGGMSSRISAALTSASKAMDTITADGDAFAETIKNVGSALEKVAYVGTAALALGAGKLAVSFAQATLASVQQAGALVLSTKASLEALTAESALAKQSLLTAETRQLEAKALVERAALELSSAEAKVASDRLRQASEVGNIKAVGSALVAERLLEEQRLRAQITDQGRALSIARIAEIRVAEVAIIRQVQAAETALASTTVATSSEITAALGAQTAARGVLAETTAAANAAMVTSDRTAAAATAGARATTVLSAASGGLLSLLSGPVGLIAMAGLVAASFIDFGSSAEKASKALIDHALSVEQATQKYKELSAEQQRYQSDKWVKEQRDLLSSAAADLAGYSVMTMTSLNQINKGNTDYQEQFTRMIAEVKAGTRTLDSVTAWTKENVKLLPVQVQRLTEISSAYAQNTKEAGILGDKLGTVDAVTKSTAFSTEKLKAAQKDSGQTDAVKAAWDKYVEQLTKTRDLLGANAAAEAAYTAAKMGATPAQAAQAKVISDQIDTLKKYQDAIKENNKVEQTNLKAQLVALYTAEDAATEAAAAVKKAHEDSAKAAKDSADQQISQMQRVIDQAVNLAKGRNILLLPDAKPDTPNKSGYSLLTNGGTAPVVPVAPKATPDQRAAAAIAQIDATTEANKRVDKAANAAATALKNQAKALDDLLAKSGISTKSANDMADAYLGGADNVRAMTIQQKIEEELLKTGAGARDQVTKAVNDLQDAEDRRDVLKAAADLKVEVEQTIAQATATLQGKAALEAFNIQKSMTIALVGKNIAVGSEEYKQLLKQTEAQLAANKALESAGRVEGIVDRLSPEIKLLRDYKEAQQDLTDAMKTAPENVALYQDALVKLGYEYEVNRSKATLWGQMTEGAIDRIDEAFASAWGNIGSGAESLWDNLKKGFKQTLGEIAHMLTTKPLLASISNWLTGTDNGQGLSSVWNKLLGTVGGSSSGSSSSGGLGGMVGIGKNLYSIYSAITGVGSAVASGYASGGVSGALSGGVGYYTSMFADLGTTLSSGFSSLVSSITGTAATTTAADMATSALLQGAVTAGAESIGSSIGIGGASSIAATYASDAALSAALSGAVAEGAASIGTNIGVAGATTAAASSGIGSAISSAMASAAAMWPLAVIMGMYQSGKLYSAGVRPDGGAIRDAAGGTTLGKVALAPSAAMADIWKVTDNVLAKVVGGKWAAILSGSTFAQAMTTKVAETLFGTSYKTKDMGIQLGVDGGQFDAQQYIKQKKKGGWLSGSSKTRYLTSELDSGAKDALGSQYNDTVMGAMALFDKLNVTLNSSVLDGLNMAVTRISTQGKTSEAIQAEIDAWFTTLGDSAVVAINAATGSGFEGFSFEGMATIVNNLYAVNASLEQLGVKTAAYSVAGARQIDFLVAAAGGIDTLNTNMSSYYDSFTSDTQKSADSLEAVRAQFSQLGIVLPETSAAYKEMLKQLDVTSEAGRATFTAMTANAASAASAYAILQQRQSDYYGAFYSESENTARTIAETTAQIKALGVTLPGSRDAFRDMVESAAKDTTAGGKAIYDSLMSVAGAAGTVFDALESTAKAAADAAAAIVKAANDALNLGVTNSFSAVQRAVTAQQKAATEAYNATNASLTDMASTASSNISDLTSVGNDLSSALKALRGDSADAVQMLQAQARATLQSALATARAGGSLSGFAGLSDALDTLGSNNTDLYSSLEDFNRDQGQTANAVAELEGINGKQLTSAESTLKALNDQIDLVKDQFDQQMDVYDQQLEFAQAQLDALNGVDTSVMSVAVAIAGLNSAIVAALQATAAGAAQTNTPQNNATLIDTLYQSVLGRDASDTSDAAGKAGWAALLQNGSLSYADAAKAIANAAVGFDSSGYTGGVSQATINSSKTAAQAYLDRLKVPGFAVGGFHSGGARIVGENGPELEVTGPSRIYNANQTASMLNGGGGNDELIAEVRQLRTENRQAQFQIVKLTQKIEQTMTQWNTEGTPKERDYAL